MTTKMTTRTTTKTDNERTSLSGYLQTVFVSPDFAAAVVLVLAGVFLMSSGDVRSGGKSVLIASGALGAGLLAVVLAAVTFLATFGDRLYRRVLDKAPGGFSGAMLPHKVVAMTSAATILFAMAGAFTWKGLNETVQEIFALSTFGFLAWSIVGTVQLVFLTVWHGEQRAELRAAVETARSQARARVRTDRTRS